MKMSRRHFVMSAALLSKSLIYMEENIFELYCNMH